MSTFCHPLPRSVITDLLRVVSHALCERPGDTTPQREARVQNLTHATLGFEPRDGLEYMLSTLMTAHFELILDSMRDVFQGQLDGMKARTKSTIVALDRTMILLLKDLREARTRPLAPWAEAAAREAAEAEARYAGVSATPSEEPAPGEPSMGESPVTDAPSASSPAPVSEPAAPRRSAAPSARSTPAPDTTPAQPSARSASMPGKIPAAAPAPLSVPASPETASADTTTRDNIIAFQQALDALAETLKEAAAHDGAAVAHGGGD